MGPRRIQHFLLNDREVTLNDLGATDTLLDPSCGLDQRLRGTKEGLRRKAICGRLQPCLSGGEAGAVRYQPVNACNPVLAILRRVPCGLRWNICAGTDGGITPGCRRHGRASRHQCGGSAFAAPGFVMAALCFGG